MGDVVGADGDVRRHVYGAGAAQDLDDLPQGLGVAVRLPGERRHHIIPRLRLFSLPRRHQDVLTEASVVRDDEAHIVLQEETAHHRLAGPLQHLDDDRFPASAPVDAGGPRHHMVAVQDSAHLTLRQIQVAAALIRPQEPIAAGVADDPSRRQIHLVQQAIVRVAVAHDLPVPQHGLEPLAQGGLFLVPLEPQGRGDGVQALGGADPLQALEDLFPFRNGDGVLLWPLLFRSFSHGGQQDLRRAR